MVLYPWGTNYPLSSIISQKGRIFNHTAVRRSRLVCNSFLQYDAGLNPSDLQKTNTAVLTSASISESENTWIYSIDHSGLEFLGHSRAMLANRISFWLNINGKGQLHRITAKSTALYSV
jgi:hypothetical protein